MTALLTALRSTRAEVLATLDDFITPDPTRVMEVGQESDWPRDLSECHRAYLRVRGVGPLVAQYRGMATAVDFEDLQERTGYDIKWASTHTMNLGTKTVTKAGVREQMSVQGESGLGNTAMIIPLYSARDGSFPVIHQVKLDIPRPGYDEKGNLTGKTIKFEIPVGTARGDAEGSLPADVHPLCWERVDGDGPLLFTEGQAKADSVLTAAMREGVLVTPVCFTGVTMPYVAPGRPTNPGPMPVLSPAITEALEVSGRAVYLCWDADWRTNKSVRDALITTGRLLEDAGAVVLVVDVPPVRRDPKTGVDDYLAVAEESGEKSPLADLLADAIDLDVAEAETRQYSHDDIGRSQRFADEVLRTGSHRWCATRRGWLAWDGAHWVDDQRGSAQELAKRLVFRDASDDAARSERGITSALKLAASVPGVTVLEADLDRDGWLINTRTGVADLRTGELLPHRPEDLISKIAEGGYDPGDLRRPDYGAPTWDTLLKLVVPNATTRQWFQRAMGMAAIGVVREDLMLQLYGPGGNGKSTVFMGLQHALGDYAVTVAPEMLTQRDGAQPHQLAAIAGARLLVMPELEEGARLHVATMKKIAGREPIRACRKYEAEFSFTPSHTAVLMTNHLATVGSTDDGTWRRLRLVPFQVKLRAEDKIEDVDSKLQAEASGILAWVVAGALDYLRHGCVLGTCPEVERATSEYKQDQDVIGEFMRERLVERPDVKIKKPRLYAVYRTWCFDSGRQARSRQSLVKALREARPALEIKKSNGVEWVVGLGELHDGRGTDEDY